MLPEDSEPASFSLSGVFVAVKTPVNVSLVEVGVPVVEDGGCVVASGQSED